MPTTGGGCPIHGPVEFRIHKVGTDRSGTQRYRARCPHCHADEVRASRRAQQTQSPAPARTVVATDGSHTGSRGEPRSGAGFAYVIDENRYGYGPLALGTHTELVAVRRALAAVDGPVTLVLDHEEIYERLALGVVPRRRNAHRDAFLATMAQVADRDVQFVLRTGDTGPPVHALAHYLAFLGRTGQRPCPGQVAPGAREILAASDPYERAAALVHAALFPRASR